MWQRLTRPRHLSNTERTELLRDARQSLRLGHVRDAHLRLSRAGNDVAADAACLNLLDILCEARGQSRVAKRYFRRAIRSDPTFEPAWQNVRRLYELDALGRTDLSVAVGDPMTDLWFTRHRGRRDGAER